MTRQFGSAIPDRVKAVWEHQADAAISQANPVSNTLYTVLDTTTNVRIIGVAVKITWATTQPTPLEIVITIDGQTFIWAISNPVSGTNYYPQWDFASAPASQNQNTSDLEIAQRKAFLMEGRSVKVEVRVTWATTQPTPLVCRVKYAKMP